MVFSFILCFAKDFFCLKKREMLDRSAFPLI